MNNQKQPYGVIFDMDGVLVESYYPHFESWRSVAREFGHDLTEEQFAHEFGRTSREIIRDLWGKHFPEEHIPKFDHRKEELYRDLIRENIPAMPGLDDLLTALADDGAKMAVGSSGPIENIDLVLDGLKIRHYFSAIVSAKDVTVGKPDPQVFLTAAKILDIAPARCVVIEDALAGIQAAQRGGMKVIALTTTHSAEKLAGANLIVKDLRNLNPATIKSFF
ncbi:MAG: HAD family phosphatase [Phycisphaerae bacterium]